MRLLSIAIAIAGFVFPLWGQTCPFGISHDPYPGQCGAYHDADGDSFCDLSQPTAIAPKDDGAPTTLSHHAWQIFLTVFLLAAATEVLASKRKGLSLPLQTAWNWLLLISFLLSSLTGLYFILPPTWRPALGFNLSFWHTETGLAFIAMGLYHALRRLGCMIRGLSACFRRD